MPLLVAAIPALLADLREHYTSGDDPGKANVVDGLRVEWPDRWFHVRVSQTEPIVRVICEQRGASPRGAVRRAAGRGAPPCLRSRTANIC